VAGAPARPPADTPRSGAPARPPAGKPGRPAKPPPLVELAKDSSLYYASRVLIDGVVRPSDTRKVLEMSLDVVTWNRPQQERRHPVIRM